MTALVLTALAAVLAACTRGAPTATADLVIRHVTVASPERSQPLPDVDVVIDGSRIRSISRQADGHGPTGRQEIDGRGRYLVPGLIDSHVHLYHASGLQRRFTSNYEQLTAAYQAQQPRSFLYYGYTTVIEVNARADANRRFTSAPLHPDLLHCGTGIVLSNDFMRLDYDSDQAFFAAYPDFLHDRFTTPDLPEGQVAAAHTPASVVEAVAKQGGRCIKLYYEEALWWPAATRPHFALPSEAIVREVVAEAHARRMPVLLHGTTPAAYQFAATTGVDVLAHGMWEWTGASVGRRGSRRLQLHRPPGRGAEGHTGARRTLPVRDRHRRRRRRVGQSTRPERLPGDGASGACRRPSGRHLPRGDARRRHHVPPRG